MELGLAPLKSYTIRSHEMAEEKTTNLDGPVVFAQEVAYIMANKKVSLLDAALDWCDQRGLEPEYAASMIKKNRKMKKQLQEEAEKLKMLKVKNDD
jgi:Phage late-transcription coactivator